MSRSYKKTPISGNVPVSEKEDKRNAHSTERAHARHELETAKDLEAVMITTRREAHSNHAEFAKEGKQYQPIHVAHEGRALKELKVSAPLGDAREIHKAIGK